ncbi:PREDICTED: uncharacterized protein LOC105452212 isoform X1 [Wasmannia auropunctata]|uniref:uncharacterized protein LOC105452212 isoform X1 n=1 Tax=Wasmannia auropunctata TaxID=64793 RepID=UPI0005EDE405|nr:PREDICTED: uncharacterized protein LOC105452212 isoform X1 [Wasmannia auropunctata]
MISDFAHAGTAVKNEKYILEVDAAVGRYLFDRYKGVLFISCGKDAKIELLELCEANFDRIGSNSSDDATARCLLRRLFWNLDRRTAVEDSPMILRMKDSTLGCSCAPSAERLITLGCYIDIHAGLQHGLTTARSCPVIQSYASIFYG